MTARVTVTARAAMLLAALAAVVMASGAAGEDAAYNDPTLLFSNNRGRLIGVTSRRRETQEPMLIDEVHFTLTVEDGKGATEAEIYASEKQDAAKSKRTVLATLVAQPGGEPRKAVVRGLKGKFLGAVVRGKNALKQSKYALRVERPGMGTVHEPDRSAAEGLGAVCGLADLHAHVFGEWSFGGVHFKKSMDDDTAPDTGFLLKLSHTTRQEQQIFTRNLKQAHDDGLNVVVASAVNNEILCGLQLVTIPGHAIGVKRHGCNDMANALRQIRAAVRFADTHKDWVTIARDPWEARRAIHDGKLAMVLAVEVSQVFPEKKGDWRDQLHELYSMGVRTVFLNHQFNTRFSGAAPHAAILELAEGIKNKRFGKKGFQRGEDGLNAQGLTELGKEMIREIVRLNMFVEVAHMSVHSYRDTAELIGTLRAPGSEYPMVNSHARLGPILPSETKTKLGEFYANLEQIDGIKKSGGMIGLRNGFERMLSADPQPTTARVANNCDGSTTSVAQMVEWAEKHGLAVAIGSDLNGHAGQNSGRFGEHACPSPPKFKGRAPKRRQKAYRKQQQDAQKGTPRVNSVYDEQGMAHIGLEGDLVRDIHNVGGPIAPLAHSAEHYLRMWERMYGFKRAADAPLYSGGGGGDSRMKCSDYTKMHPASSTKSGSSSAATGDGPTTDGVDDYE